jgi:hypothetical protein
MSLKEHIKELILSPKTGIASTNNQIKSFLMGRRIPITILLIDFCFVWLEGQWSSGVKGAIFMDYQSLSKDVFPKS